MSRYLIGIDLGTTNSALAYVDAREKGVPRIHSFAVPQLVAAGETVERPLLPSFLYLPGAHDLPPGACALPWDAAKNFAVGEFARDQGAKVPGRLVASAKSWLCHAGVDRTADILPWAAPRDVPRVSPVQASARYLQHFAQAWNHLLAKDQPEHRLEKQEIVLTVPASFDEVARNLTVEAARKAGFENLTLLEEPQAAFYAWLAVGHRPEVGDRPSAVGYRPEESSTEPPKADSRKPIAGSLRPGMLCLVVDVGGGTSDFSLIQAVEQQGELGFVRLAVGDHLLLGGDNMDLALAKYVESKLPQAGRLDAAGYGQLTQACRAAKEILLSADAPAQQPITLMGRGRSVVGGALKTSLTPDEVRQTLFEGFFPATRHDEMPARGARAGLHEMGLPYVSDPAITRHLAAFLQQHGSVTQRPPDAILFNGGVFQPASVRERLLEVMRHWYAQPIAQRDWQPLVLANASLDLAVAWGAAYYGWLRHTGGRRIGGGIARSYYVAVEGGDAETRGRGDAEIDVQPSTLRVSASPRLRVSVLCVVPQHLEEGQEITLDEPELELALGKPVAFPLFTSTVRDQDRPGQMLEVAPEQLLQLPPLHTVLRGGKRSGTKRVPVKLAARLTAIGTLELWCVAKNSDNRWRLEFNLRESVGGLERESAKELESDSADRDSARTLSPSHSLTETWPEEKIQAGAEVVRAVFAGREEQPAKELTKLLEKALELSRGDWPAGLCRRLVDFFHEVADQRRASAAHLARWYNLVGYCLRPGFGDPLDQFRVEQLWKVLHGVGYRPEVGFRPSAVGYRPEESSPQPPKAESRKLMADSRKPTGDGGAEYWIMWRRVAGGLNGSLQRSLFDRLRPMLLPAKGGKGPPYRPGASERAEMWRAAASLERLEPMLKEQLGQVLLKQLRRSPTPAHGFWALTRLGGRVLLYGPLNALVHPHTAEQWLTAILPFQPGNDSERQAWLFCLSQLARRTGQRALDVNDEVRDQVIDALRVNHAREHLMQMVEKGGELESGEEKQFFGEALPIGLRLAGTAQAEP